MQTTTLLLHNICVRCGKPRLVSKTWKEKVGNVSTIFSVTVCPDDECQKIVDRENAKQKAKRDHEKEVREQRKQQQTANIKKKPQAKKAPKKTKKRR